MNQIKIDQALSILKALELPREQQNTRSALCLLALLNLGPDKDWANSESPLIGITPMMAFANEQYGKKYAPNTRETFRRQTMHQFVDAGVARYNPDDPTRAVNSPKAVYQITPEALQLIQQYGSDGWDRALYRYRGIARSLALRYAHERDHAKLPVIINNELSFQLSAGEHSELIKAIIEEFAPRFVPGTQLIYAGDTGEKMGYFDTITLAHLNVTLDKHGKMPDVILHWKERNWLILIECVTSHGPVNPKRQSELKHLFSLSTAGLVYVTAFPTRSLMSRYLADIAWETEVWVADAPSHMIHFNGERFLGPY